MIQKSKIAVIYQSRLIIEKTVVHHLKSLSMRRQLWWQKQFRLIPLTYYQQFLSFSSYLNNVEGECGWKHFIQRHENLVPPIIMWKLDENVLILRIADQSRVYPFIMRNGLYFIGIELCTKLKWKNINIGTHNSLGRGWPDFCGWNVSCRNQKWRA